MDRISIYAFSHDVALAERPPSRVAVTVTPGTAAPLTSTTVPSIEPVVDVCANAVNETHRTNSDRTIKRMLFFMLNDPFFLVIPLALPGALTPKTDGLKLSGMGGIAVLLFDSGKKRINSEANFASLMPIGDYRTNHRSINHLAPS